LLLHIEIVRGEGFCESAGVNVLVSIDVEDDFFSAGLAFSNEKQEVLTEKCTGVGVVA
jgi:hypothetical protein